MNSLGAIQKIWIDFGTPGRIFLDYKMATTKGVIGSIINPSTGKNIKIGSPAYFRLVDAGVFKAGSPKKEEAVRSKQKSSPRRSKKESSTAWELVIDEDGVEGFPKHLHFHSRKRALERGIEFYLRAFEYDSLKEKRESEAEINDRFQFELKKRSGGTGFGSLGVSFELKPIKWED